MHAYRFRLLSDEKEDFVMDIEIGANQTFKDFHDVIRESAGIKNNELASFFICNRKWQKQQEITLIDMGDTPDDATFGDEETNFSIPISVMEKSIIRDYIDDPHQRLLYDFDILNQRSLYIELLKVFEVDEKAKLPVCSSVKGTLFSKERDEDGDFKPPEVDEDELLKEFEEIIKGDDEDSDGEVFFDE